jgi:hypothetical protein
MISVFHWKAFLALYNVTLQLTGPIRKLRTKLNAVNVAPEA